MKRKDFGDIVRALRREQVDENYQPWTQATLAAETGLSLEVIRRIERGEKRIIHEEELTLLADVFQLTSMERRQFFIASLDIAEASVPRQESSPETVLNMLANYLSGIRLPAYVGDNYHDAVLANPLIIALLNLNEAARTAPTTPAGFNIARIGFDPDIGYLDLMGADWHKQAIYNMRYFRARTFTVRHTEYYRYLLQHLRKLRLFERYWREVQYEEDDHFSGHMPYDYHHPDFGRLQYVVVETITITSAGTLSAVVYVPTSENTAAVFEMLAQTCGTTSHRFAPWPDKQILV